ncbi:uncharacterized protein PHALS_02085 [Plasmopara halstedii]|uniref:Uncharacterized protein n=1 Tax=Plasmopara halstedii TaxID=4781 RepID=A0A0P1AXK6_PLAHL|nr:uncharacterized protein PHALS_02085 [Plasmopara halstedii]CEG45813.1 hypothetical protein PHALS_02085 [Plasmopara halstedii]|eukprot:XP_024582182.1 hypothetical protein PHALS_02085 [Plasmopara halstedii]
MSTTRQGTISSPYLTSSVPASTITEVPEEQVHDPEELCRYPSKKCWNLRVLKRNGERHNLCEFHRQKANKNQRRLEFKRKARTQIFVDAENPIKRFRSPKLQEGCSVRTSLSVESAIREVARVKGEEIGRANSAVSSDLTNNFLQDLVLLNVVHDRIEVPSKELQPDSFSMRPVGSTKAQEDQQLRLLDAVNEAVLNRILEDEPAESAAMLKSLRCTLQEEDIMSLPKGLMSPVDVGEGWNTLYSKDYWLATSLADQLALSCDAQLVMDENVLVADV